MERSKKSREELYVDWKVVLRVVFVEHTVEGEDEEVEVGVEVGE